MYPTCRTDGVWRSLVARPLWERKVVGSNPATPTIRPPPHPRKIALWGSSCLRLLCKLWASCVLPLLCKLRPVCLCTGPVARAVSRSGAGRTPEVSHQGDRTVKSAVETLNPTRVRLTVEVPFEELKDSLDAAYKKINQQVTVKGFRKGKIPARVIDQRFGRGAVLEEAVNDALPKFYTEAVNEAEINAARPARGRHHRAEGRRDAGLHRRGRRPPGHRDPGLLRHRGRGRRRRGHATRTSRSRSSSCVSASPPPPRSSAPPRRATS